MPSTTRSLSPMPAPAIDAAAYKPSAAMTSAPRTSLMALASALSAVLRASARERKRHTTPPSVSAIVRRMGKNHHRKAAS